MSDTPKITVMTPTYNRRSTLHRVYDSLRAQTERSFEWRIVDDGSTDGTDELVKEWQSEADFPIHYVWQENLGMHFAVNRGAREARGEFFCHLDSDDGCLPEALERVLYHWNNIPEEQRAGFAGVSLRCKDEDGKQLGMLLPFDPMDSTTLELHYKYKVRGEAWMFVRTSVVRAHLLPETVSQAVIPESIMWNQIGRTYKIRFVNEHLRVYYQQSAAGDRLNHLSQRKRVPARQFYANPLINEMDWFWYAPHMFMKKAIQYVLLCALAKDTPATQLQRLPTFGARALWLGCLLPGYFLALYYSPRKTNHR